MADFEQLVASRKEWIESVLRPWCVAAPLAELKKAEQEWTDIAGRPAPEATLWTWAWSRFPELVHEGLTGVNETRAVCVTLKSGIRFEGFPDGRRSERGQLWLIQVDEAAPERLQEHGPLSIDQIETVEPVS